MKFKKAVAMSLALMMAISCLSACGTNQKLSAREQIIKTNSEIIVAIGSEPETGFDSTTGGHGSITKVIFSTLFKRDKKLGWENDLATGYKVSDDKLTWTVTLRAAKFTDGASVKAEDVLYTYETAKKAGADIELLSSCCITDL